LGDRSGADAVDVMIAASRQATESIVATLCERVRVRNLYDDAGIEITNAAELIKLASEAQLAELRRVVEQGITEAEGKGCGPLSGD